MTDERPPRRRRAGGGAGGPSGSREGVAAARTGAADEAAAAGLARVPARRLLIAGPRVRIPFLPGDRPMVEPGARVAQGDLLADRVRDARLVETSSPPANGPAGLRTGAWLSAEHARPGRREGSPAGELLYEDAGRRLLASGPHLDTLEAPAAGTVLVVEPGAAIVMDLDGVAIAGSALLGDPARGPLTVLAPDADPRLVLDVGLAGAIVVLPGRADAEALIRSRAMGISGAVVGSLAERDRRDLAASERRQRAGLHRLAPFGVLVLDGFLRRPIAGPIRALLAALSGAVVGLVGDPPILIAEAPSSGLPMPGPDRVRVRGGPEAGREGRWVASAGTCRFRSGILVEAAFVALDDGPTVAIALGDLERFC